MSQARKHREKRGKPIKSAALIASAITPAMKKELHELVSKASRRPNEIPIVVAPKVEKPKMMIGKSSFNLLVEAPLRGAENLGPLPWPSEGGVFSPVIQAGTILYQMSTDFTQPNVSMLNITDWYQRYQMVRNGTGKYPFVVKIAPGLNSLSNGIYAIFALYNQLEASKFIDLSYADRVTTAGSMGLVNQATCSKPLALKVPWPPGFTTLMTTPDTTTTSTGLPDALVTFFVIAMTDISPGPGATPSTLGLMRLKYDLHLMKAVPRTLVSSGPVRVFASRVPVIGDTTPQFVATPPYMIDSFSGMFDPISMARRRSMKASETLAQMILESTGGAFRLTTMTDGNGRVFYGFQNVTTTPQYVNITSNMAQAFKQTASPSDWAAFNDALGWDLWDWLTSSKSPTLNSPMAMPVLSV